jgi:4-hydroxybutyrate CoA-transferase
MKVLEEIMKIGIKYCGGCNPTYDRIDVVLRLKKHISKGHNIEMIKQGIVYDIVIILCGCSCACVSHKNIEAKYEKVCIVEMTKINYSILYIK